MSTRHDFARALLDPELPCPAGLVAWNGSNPARRFQVYRNNVLVALVDALASNFVVTHELVGEAFFGRWRPSMSAPIRPARRCWPATAPTFRLHRQLYPGRGLPYLADVARLEYLRAVACHAADVSPVGEGALAAQLADEGGLPGLRFALHPSLAVLPSRFAVVSLWAAHQGVGDLAAVVPDVAETALVLRTGLEVEVIEIPPASGVFIAALQSGRPLGQAAEEATALGAGFDLAATLGLLLQKSAITTLHPSGAHHEHAFSTRQGPLPSPALHPLERLTRWLSGIPDGLVLLLGRFSIAAVFWKSGQTKIEGLAIDLISGEFQLGWPRLAESALFLFENEYRLPCCRPRWRPCWRRWPSMSFPSCCCSGWPRACRPSRCSA
jgi:hypothetical protein